MQGWGGGLAPPHSSDLTCDLCSSHSAMARSLSFCRVAMISSDRDWSCFNSSPSTSLSTCSLACAWGRGRGTVRKLLQ